MLFRSVIAQAFATLACLAPGRVILGAGTGESLNEVVVGMDWPEQSERFARFKEALDLIARLWREERLTYEGQFYKTHNATIYDRPEQPVPIYIAAAEVSTGEFFNPLVPEELALALRERRASPR